MKVEALTTYAPSPTAKFQRPFSAGEIFDVTREELDLLGTAVRSLDPVLPKSVKPSAKKEPVEPKTANDDSAGKTAAEESTGTAEAEKPSAE